ncbi:MAG TPA: glycosyltransferase [Pyrinomonadaceae bacterium]|nr:glycosyltransferase [Pyrinomonadaceae bacterium]
MPKVSIITAAYNHVRFVRQCLESAQSQTYRDFEHVVVDDGSSDGTADILQSFAGKINYIRQENRGTHAAINRGIRASSGKYIALLDSDDIWLPNKLELQIQRLDESPETGLVYSQANVIDPTGNPKNNGEPIGRPFADPRRTYEELLKDNHIPALTAVFRRSCAEEVGYFNESLKAMSDWDLWIRIAAKWSTSFVPEVLAHYRDHGNNTWHALVKNGRVDKERLLVLRNAAAAIADTDSDAGEKREVIDSLFRELALKTAYGLWYRHHYSEARAYLLFALSIRPMLLKDAVLALRLRFIPRLVAGEWGTKAFGTRRRWGRDQG